LFVAGGNSVALSFDPVALVLDPESSWPVIDAADFFGGASLLPSETLLEMAATEAFCSAGEGTLAAVVCDDRDVRAL
jgi:hypothetical protein